MNLQSFFNKKAKQRDKWIRKNKYYNHELIKFYKYLVPQNKKILEIGSGTGHLLNALKPSYGVGIDFSDEMNKVAKTKYPSLKFYTLDATKYDYNEKFDYIIVSDTVGYFQDIQEVFKNIKKNCTNQTRIIINSFNFVWEPIIQISEKFNLKMRQPFTNWLSCADIQNLLKLEGYDTINTFNKILMPKNIPILSNLSNKYLVNLPVFDNFHLTYFIIARPIFLEKDEKSLSIIVPARNEKGNIENIVKELPNLGKSTELIFIEGGSNDNTYEEIERVAKKYSKTKNIIYAKQDKKGKADAVWKGFDMASGDILMIYDADMTVPPKDLIKFYEAIASNKGEFINGCRLVYPMEKEAMRTFNLFGNKMFSIIFTWLLNQRIKDTLCGTKVITKKNYEELKKNRAYFGDFDPFGDFDLLFGSAKMNLKIAEIPIRYKERTYGTTNIDRIKHGIILLKMCWFASKRIKFI